jgi:hypothetical protein
MKPLLGWLAGLLLIGSVTSAADSALVEFDDVHWTLQGDARFVTYDGRASIRVDGGGAVLNDVLFDDGVIEFDVLARGERGFLGVQFRLDDAGNGEWVYLRPHKSGLPDALQYTPILGTGLNWQLYSGPGFTGPAAVPRDQWLHARLDIRGATATLFLDDMATPMLVMPDLKSGVRKGAVALAVLLGETYFANVRVTPREPASWVRQQPAMPAGMLTHWRLSPAFDAGQRNPEQALTKAEMQRIEWQKVEAEAPGLVAITRYRAAPHLRVSFANDPARRMEAQPGAQLIYARTRIDAADSGLRRLQLGYSDEVSVFLNGEILYRGRSAQYFRDPGFLGIMDVENDAVYLPLKKGQNELVLAITELGGGWGFAARLDTLNR